jgi:hypothetical protein
MASRKNSKSQLVYESSGQNKVRISTREPLADEAGVQALMDGSLKNAYKNHDSSAYFEMPPKSEDVMAQIAEKLWRAKHKEPNLTNNG